MASFTVDTHVFRELGELLVGRDSTALIELIKNAYDADATSVVVHGDNLSDLDRGFITVVDDGVGMNQKQFEEGFLRIASRSKDTGTRRSKRFGRQYTGAKGIGRLAAHKLSRKITVDSIAWKSSGGQPEGVSASIDWDLVEKYETLDQVAKSDAIRVEATQPQATVPGTAITLERLRRKWTPTQRGRFLEELQTFAPPPSLSERLPAAVLDTELLFRAPAVRDGSDQKPFAVELIGELAPPDDYWTAALAAANWIVEIDAANGNGKVRYGIAPTKRTREEYPDLRSQTFSMPHPMPKNGPQLQARILIRAGQAKGSDDAKAWAGRANGIRIYMEGFRVLPYGELRNDWLGLDRDASERARDLLAPSVAALVQPKLRELGENERPGLSHLPSKHYFGAVFLTQSGAPGLRPLVNREGFVPDEHYDAVVMIVRTAIDLATRVRAAASLNAREARRSVRSKADDATTAGVPAATDIGVALRAAEGHAAEARTYAAAGNSKAAAVAANLAIEQIKSVTAGSEEIADQAAMLRVLASVGTQLSSFVHELRSLLAMAEAVESALALVIEDSTELKRDSKSRLRGVLQSLGDLRRQLEREASYLIDVVSPDSTRRRSRQRLSKRFEAAARLISMSANRRNITVENVVPEELKSPPMFSAELTSVFANLLTNAIKAAGPGGRIRATGRMSGDHTVVRIENTGVSVNLADAERWFRAFESSTTEVDSVLGQGMGLGLTITRRILDEYGCSISFVKPSSGFKTALEITFNG